MALVVGARLAFSIPQRIEEIETKEGILGGLSGLTFSIPQRIEEIETNANRSHLLPDKSLSVSPNGSKKLRHLTQVAGIVIQCPFSIPQRIEEIETVCA